MNAITMNGYERISKAKARKLFEQGKTIYIQSCNMTPVNPWQSAHEIDPAHYKEENYSFDSMVNNYEYYNTDCERGYYAAFYVKR